MPSPEWLTDLLNEHHALRDGGTEQVVCWCLWKPEERLWGFAEWDAVRAHVAEVVWAEIERRVVSVEPNMAGQVFLHAVCDALDGTDGTP